MVQKFAYERHRKPYLHFGRKSYCERAPRAPADPVTKRSRWRCSTAARPAHGACCGPETGAAGLMAAMKAATCGNTFAHTHRDSGIRCSSSQKSAGPAGQQLLRDVQNRVSDVSATFVDYCKASLPFDLPHVSPGRIAVAKRFADTIFMYPKPTESYCAEPVLGLCSK